MSVDTHGILKNYVTPNELLNYIKKTYDKNARHDVKRTYYGDLADYTEPYILKPHSRSKKGWYCDVGFIYFNDGADPRNLYYFYENVLRQGKINEFKEMNPNIDSSILFDHVWLSLGYWGNSVFLMSDIIANLGGGVIDKNDCDDVDYEFINPLQYRLEKARRQ